MNQKTDQEFHPSSFRDPSGFIFRQDDHIYRQVNEAGASAYETLMQSGLYSDLVKKRFLIPHEEVDLSGTTAYKILKPELIPFLSFAYEWSFDMWRDAALLTLNICMASLKHKLILKDAAPFNVQFVSGSPVFIDTLSFEIYDETKPWVAYRQFCECFLSPLLLANYFGNEQLKLFQIYPGGIPIKYAAVLLPFGSWFKPLSLFNIHLQSRVSANVGTANTAVKFSKQKLLNVLTHLGNGIKSLAAPKNRTVWDDYYSTTIASADYLANKDRIFRLMLQQTSGSTAVDLGANDGYFSKIAAEAGYNVIATDIDSNSINRLYLEKNKSVLPLILDLTNPSPALGWMNRERQAFFQRTEADLVLALALVHHLAIAENTPFRLVAEMLSQITKRYLIIEFVEKHDVKAKVLLARKNINYGKYSRENFGAALSSYFELVVVEPLLDGDRKLYLFKRKNL